MIGISRFAQRYVELRATELLTDQCLVYRTGEPSIDHETNEYRYPEPIVIYEGPCRLWESPASLAMNLNDEQVQLTTPYISFPWDIDPIPEMEDVVKVTESRDSDIVGRTFTLGAPSRGGNLRGSRRFVVKSESSSKEEW